MSTRRLRAAHARGVHVTAAGYLSYSNSSFCVCAQLVYIVMAWSTVSQASDIVLPSLELVFFLSCVWLYCRAEQDQRAFAAACTAKILLMLGVCILANVVLGGLPISVATWLGVGTYLLFGVLGMDGLSKFVPVFGVQLAELLGPGNIVRLDCCSRSKGNSRSVAKVVDADADACP
eukprot:TRINITY_DN100833_c0_g1_i1.p1 TRINITY_DN100833_c0_g1~~TRINITY_DN100833_c0_g1_i1.p1  ORF type:complete len:189 (-),score=22.21 TRINITY_DN100833_c0_g1_i1:9-536(-)